MKKLLLLLLPFSLFAQSKFDLKGFVQDTNQAPLGFTSIMLLEEADSSLVTFVLADDKGRFEFKGLPRKPYLLKATFMSYLPFQEKVSPPESGDLDWGAIELKPIAQELYEVVIKTAKAPISVKGDTIEYDASKFKVPPGSTVEDLLRKLPGVEILQDGSIQAQGEEVRRVTVDGKRFFGDDPKMATRNLGADAVKKVQVFNDKSEQAKLTGVDDGKREKAMNLELKEEAKKGGFGKITAGVGTDNRMNLSGNYNKFDSKNQLSAVGFGNNLNQTGMSWDDFQDFRGSNAFRWNDDGDFGFSQGGFRIFYFDGDDDNESFDIPRGGRSEGLSDNAAGGVNYNYNHKKTELSSSYFYNQSRQYLDAFQNRENFLSNNASFRNTTDSYQNNFNGNHRVTLRASKELDSLNTLTVIGNGRLSTRTTFLDSYQEIFRGSVLSNETSLLNEGERLSYAIAGTGIYRHKFKSKAKRSFALSGTYQLSNADTEASQQSTNKFLQTSDLNEQIQIINQLTADLNKQATLKSSALWLEPLGEKFYWETFYNIRLRQDEIDRGVQDVLDVGTRRNDALSSYYDNSILFQRIGTSIRYSHKGKNLAVGLAGQQFNINGDVRNAKDAPVLFPINRTFNSIVPNVNFSYSMKNNRYLGMDYNVGVEEPNVRDMQPVINNSNPLFITQGNPDLKPATTHSISTFYNQFNPATFINLNANFNYSYLVDQVVYNQTVDPVSLITTTRPENISGGSRIYSYVGFGFPIKKTISTLNLNGGFNYSEYFVFINNVENQTNSLNYNLGVRLSYTPKDWFTFYARSNFSIGNTRYSINTSQNQEIFNNSYSAEMNLKLPGNLFFNSVFNYNTFKNERFGFDQKLPIWNSTLFIQLGEKKRSELRLSAYDMLKRNLGISQSASQNFVSTRQVITLSRYFMLSYTYNMRGTDAKMRKQWW